MHQCPSAAAILTSKSPIGQFRDVQRHRSAQIFPRGHPNNIRLVNGQQGRTASLVKPRQPEQHAHQAQEVKQGPAKHQPGQREVKHRQNHHMSPAPPVRPQSGKLPMHRPANYPTTQPRQMYGGYPQYVPYPQQANPEPVQPAQRLPQKQVSADLEKDLEQGKQNISFNQLTLVESLGSGEFGQVFRGFYQRKEVAIKKLYWDNSMITDTVVQDLEREIESFRHLKHERLVEFIGACLDFPNLCLVTELMPGGSLHNLLHVKKVTLPIRQQVNMCMQLADGVAYLHAQVPKIVHRDLKSLNVVLDHHNNAKICDFGLTESMERTHITKKNNGGSPRYMAPELFDEKSKITEKIDIWALGCIFIEIFGGGLPYEGCNSLPQLTRIMLEGKKIPKVPSNMSKSMRALVISCLDFNHVMRPTAKQIFDQLKVIMRESMQAEAQVQHHPQVQRMQHPQHYQQHHHGMIQMR